MRPYNTTFRAVAGAFMSVFGLALLAGSYLYGRSDHVEAAANPVVGPLLESFSLIFMALAGVFIAAGAFITVQALRRGAKARRTGIGSGFGDRVREP